MDYKTLPLEERITLASQYALLLMADMKTAEDIIPVLKKDYALNEAQARQALAAMRSDYEGEYKATFNSNLNKLLGALGVNVVAFLAYYFIGREMGGAQGGFALFFAIVFGLSAIGTLVLAGKIIQDKFTDSTAPKIKRPPDKWANILSGIFYMAVILFAITAYDYWAHRGVVDQNELVTVHGCVLSDSLLYAHTGAKSKSYYYIFRFREQLKTFHFQDDYYNYATGRGRIAFLKKGDTVSIQIAKRDQQRFENKYVGGTIELLNLGWDNHFLVDHTYRNAWLERSHTKTFNVFAAICGFLLLAVVARKLYWRKKIDN